MINTRILAVPKANYYTTSSSSSSSGSTGSSSISNLTWWGQGGASGAVSGDMINVGSISMNKSLYMSYDTYTYAAYFTPTSYNSMMFNTYDNAGTFDLSYNSLKIGPLTFSYDAKYNAIKLVGNFYATGGVTALGAGGIIDSGSGTGTSLGGLLTAMNGLDTPSTSGLYGLTVNSGNVTLNPITSSGSGTVLQGLTSILNSEDYLATTANTYLSFNGSDYVWSTVKETPNLYSLTVQKNGSSIGTFNPTSANSTINVTVPTKTSELTNDSNYVTTTSQASTLSNYVTKTDMSNASYVTTSNLSSTLSNYPTKTQLSNIGYVTSTSLSSTLSNYPTKSDIVSVTSAYINTVTTSGSGNVVTGGSTSGHTLTLSKGITALTSASTVNGSGNAITSVSQSGSTVTFNKGNTFVDLSSDQTISGVKTFSNGFKIGNVNVTYDSTNKAIKFDGNIYATGGVTALGAGSVTDSGGSTTTLGGLLTAMNSLDTPSTSGLYGLTVNSGNVTLNPITSSGSGGTVLQGLTSILNSEDYLASTSGTYLMYNGSDYVWGTSTNMNNYVTTSALTSRLSNYASGVSGSGSGNAITNIGFSNGKITYTVGTISGGSSTSGMTYAGLVSYLAQDGDKSPWNKIAYISSSGVMEAGRYIDFHWTGSSVDYSARLMLGSETTGTVVNLPTTSGTLVHHGNLVAYVNKIQSDGSGNVVGGISFNTSAGGTTLTYHMTTVSGSGSGSTSVTSTTTGSGNAITALSASGSTITAVKGNTFVDLSSEQQITGFKQFNYEQVASGLDSAPLSIFDTYPFIDLYAGQSSGSFTNSGNWSKSDVSKRIRMITTNGKKLLMCSGSVYGDTTARNQGTTLEVDGHIITASTLTTAIDKLSLPTTDGVYKLKVSSGTLSLVNESGGTVDPDPGQISYYGTNPWAEDDQYEFYDGTYYWTYCHMSANNQTMYKDITFEVSNSPTDIYLTYMQSSERNYDFGVAYLDNVQLFSMKGCGSSSSLGLSNGSSVPSSVTQYTYTISSVSAGSHTIRLWMKSDGSTLSGDSSAYMMIYYNDWY